MIDLKQNIRIIPIHVIHPRANKETTIRKGEELESLIDTLGGTIVERIIQKLERPDHTTFIGKGKVLEVMQAVKEKKADVIILNAMVKPRQVHELKKELQKVRPEIQVWDRVDLILQIFDKHATTKESKLQISLARMNYMGPRIYGMGYVLSRQGGGIGTLGVGETNTELMKRHWRDEKKNILNQLAKINTSRIEQLKRRKKSGYKTVSIVGYTNAGKSSLFTILTGKGSVTKNVLFATLDSSVGKIYLKDLQREVLVTDTIGFIRDLPPLLISAFKATLMESIHADLLLHVVDVADPEISTKISVVNSILTDLGVASDNQMYVFNKADLLSGLSKTEISENYKGISPLFVSSTKRTGLEMLQHAIANRLSVPS